MTGARPHAKLAFVKLIVRDLDVSRRFYEQALGFAVRDAFDTGDFGELILAQPETDVSLILLAFRDGRPIPDGRRHGPAGFLTDDIAASHAHLLACGATAKDPIVTVDGGIKVAFLHDPDGHPIELCQFPD